MLKRFLPKEDKFFLLFQEISELIVQAAQEFSESLKNPQVIEKKAKIIRELEAKADSITHNTLERLHNTLITPFDRHDIYNLIQSLDDIIDLIHAVSERLIIYDVKHLPPITLQLANKSNEAIFQVQKAVACLKDMKKSDILRLTCSEIHRLENESDVLFRESIAKLFREEGDIKMLISLKDIHEILETIADRCEDVASLIESLLLEYT